MKWYAIKQDGEDLWAQEDSHHPAFGPLETAHLWTEDDKVHEDVHVGEEVYEIEVTRCVVRRFT